MNPVVALDLATKTGVAVGIPGDEPEAYSVDLGKGKSEDVRLATALRLTRDVIRLHEPELLAIEAPIGGKDTSHFLVGLAACVRAMAFVCDVPVHVCLISSVRKHFLGRALSGRDFPGMSKAASSAAIKGQVMLRCRDLGWDVRDHDAADAAATWDYACAHAGLGQSVPLGDLFAPARRRA